MPPTPVWKLSGSFRWKPPDDSCLGPLNLGVHLAAPADEVTVSRHETTVTMDLPSNALWDAFTDGHRFEIDDGKAVTTRVADAGCLVLTTGQIVVSDPILDPFNKPFSVSVPADTYPVLLSLIEDEVALVMVVFAEGPPVRWQAAKPDSFSVDSATACLMDHKVCRFLRRKAENDKYERYIRRFQDAMEENDGLWGSYCVDPESGANVVLFRTWDGDGVFPSFFGYDAEGEVVCLVIDTFLCFDHVPGVEP